jgi:hypothetical protein
VKFPLFVFLEISKSHSLKPWECFSNISPLYLSGTHSCHSDQMHLLHEPQLNSIDAESVITKILYFRCRWLICTHLFHCSCQWWKHLSDSSFGIANSCSVGLNLIASTVSKHMSHFLSLGNRNGVTGNCVG